MQEQYSDLPLLPESRNKSPTWKVPCQETEGIFITRDREFRAEKDVQVSSTFGKFAYATSLIQKTLHLHLFLLTERNMKRFIKICEKQK